ncbi:hypothetical protein CLV72_106356 [Allonocardiopsis opalescens]|uniref:Uncharacterized protein n=1 Tax=Allonocardiopsis opalescens TaxID=1144618 RepID=A0A2T0Q0K2_9ACTN|nr:hypothetical protein CLV72_106356 [Allonocardiopsis opalescens]
MGYARKPYVRRPYSSGPTLLGRARRALRNALGSRHSRPAARGGGRPFQRPASRPTARPTSVAGRIRRAFNRL